MSTVLHTCLDIRGALAWPKARLKGLLRHDDGREASSEEVHEWLCDQLAAGKRVLPMGEPCDGFSFETGCPGHVQTPETWP
jgi:hypothetical protein